MDFLKKFWPFSFAEKKDVAALVKTVILYVVAGIVLGVVGYLVGLLHIPVLPWIISAVGYVYDLYATAAIVFTFLHYFKVMK